MSKRWPDRTSEPHNCRCFTADSNAEFQNLRTACNALKLLVPDDYLECFLEWDKLKACKNNEAYHRSTILLALERGCLGKITAPIHKFLVGKNTQYKNAIVEKWMMESSSIERHHKSKVWLGKLMELKFAEYLSADGWEIIDLEAWTQNAPDVVAANSCQQKVIFEIKYIGQDDDDFLEIVNSLKGQGKVYTSSPYIAYNYALVRMYEAAVQLERHQIKNDPQKHIVLIFDSSIWENHFKLPFSEMFKEIKFNNEESVKGDAKWQSFFNCKILKKYPAIENKISSKIGNIDDIWIMKSYLWELSRQAWRS